MPVLRLGSPVRLLRVAVGPFRAVFLRHLFQQDWALVRGEIGESDRGKFVCNPVSPTKGREPSEAIGVFPSRVDPDILVAEICWRWGYDRKLAKETMDPEFVGAASLIIHMQHAEKV